MDLDFIAVLEKGNFHVKKIRFWLILLSLTYGFIELLSLGGLFYLHKYLNIQYEPIDVITPKQAKIIKRFIEQKTTYHEFSPSLGWTLKKNGSVGFYRANSSGIRSSREYALTPPPGVRRVSTFGNSFTHGQDVKNGDTYQAVMERLDSNIEVLNFGVSSYGLDQAYLRYLEDGQPFQSHFVLIGYYTENIFRHVNTYRPFYFSKTAMPSAKPRFVLKEGRLSLIPNHIQRLQDYQNLLLHPQDVLSEIGIHDYYYQRRYKLGMFDWSPMVRLTKIQIQELKKKLSDNEIILSGQYGYNEKSEAFNLTKKIFDEFYESSLKNNSTPIIVIFPGYNDLLNYLRMKRKQYSALLSYFDSAGYKYIDLMEPLERAYFRGFKLEQLFIGHYSPLVNKKVAKFILNYLNNMNTKYPPWSTNFVYTPRGKGPAALLVEGRVSGRGGWQGKKGAFLNSL